MTPRRRAVVAAALLAPSIAVVVVGTVVAERSVERERAAAEGEPAEAPVDEAATEQELLDAWRRWRSVRLVVEGTWERELPDGRRIEQPRTVAQRPPDRLERQGGEVAGRLDGRRVSCTEGAEPPCVLGPELPSYRAELEAELADLAAQPYRVERAGDGCFRLTLEDPSLLAPAYGERATLCFDEPTGALRSLVVTRPTGTDRVRATAIREVTDADLALPAAP